MKPCLIVPCYNHEAALPLVLERLKPYGLPGFLIDDGSSQECKQVLDKCLALHTDWLTLVTRPMNGGKGAAVVDGFNAAIAHGYSHALQIDADGQHDATAIPEFLAASQRNPQAMILGKPLFDGSIPTSRLHGRKITNFWIAINTLSTSIADGMCGYRLYPLVAIQQLLKTTTLAQRMDFDIDIVVRLYWQGVPTVNLPVSVRYPEDGVSHFRLCRDNVLISLAHAKLFFGMMVRLPQLLGRHWKQ